MTIGQSGVPASGADDARAIADEVLAAQREHARIMTALARSLRNAHRALWRARGYPTLRRYVCAEFFDKVWQGTAELVQRGRVDHARAR